MRSQVWLYPGAGGWHFVTLPKQDAQTIRTTFGSLKRGWGSLPVTVTIGRTSWETSIFPDAQAESYVLPIKVEVRRKEKISLGDDITFTIQIRS
jgi:hypothetical protein